MKEQAEQDHNKNKQRQPYQNISAKKPRLLLGTLNVGIWTYVTYHVWAASNPTEIGAKKHDIFTEVSVFSCAKLGKGYHVKCTIFRRRNKNHENSQSRPTPKGSCNAHRGLFHLAIHPCLFETFRQLSLAWHPFSQ